MWYDKRKFLKKNVFNESFIIMNWKIIRLTPFVLQLYT